VGVGVVNDASFDVGQDEASSVEAKVRRKFRFDADDRDIVLELEGMR
jgi:hypothetical protein